MSAFDGTTLDAGLDDLLAANREQTAAEGKHVSSQPGVAVNARLEARAEERAEAEFEEETYNDEQDMLAEEQHEAALAERVDQEALVEAFLAGEYEPQSEAELLHIFALAEELDGADEQAQEHAEQQAHLAQQQQAWYALAQQHEHAHPGTGQRFLEALWYGETTDLEHAKQLALAETDLPSAIAHRLRESAGLAETARQLNEAGWDTGHGDWEQEANLARDLSLNGIDPFDVETVADVAPHILANEGDVAAAVADYQAAAAAEDAHLDAELYSLGIDPDSPEAIEISRIAWQQTNGDVGEAVARWRMEQP